LPLPRLRSWNLTQNQTNSSTAPHTAKAARSAEIQTAIGSGAGPDIAKPGAGPQGQPPRHSWNKKGQDRGAQSA
jgi:hypothetical protein